MISRTAALGLLCALLAGCGEQGAGSESTSTLMYAEHGVDRPGGDLARLTMTGDDVAFCATACIERKECQAFTYVARGVQGPEAVCYLKRVRSRPVSNPCCVSGVAPGRW